MLKQVLLFVVGVVTATVVVGIIGGIGIRLAEGHERPPPSVSQDVHAPTAGVTEHR